MYCGDERHLLTFANAGTEQRRYRNVNKGQRSAIHIEVRHEQTDWWSSMLCQLRHWRHTSCLLFIATDFDPNDRDPSLLLLKGHFTFGCCFSDAVLRPVLA